MSTRKYWLMKSEPEVFSWEDLLKAPRRTTSWEGVRNYQARNFLRDTIRKGDLVLFYHSNADPTGIFGIAEVVREGYPDDSALDPKSEYYDPKAKAKGESPWFLVDVKAAQALERPVTRDMLAKEPKLAEMMVLRRGARLSVQPVTAEEFRVICRIGGAKPL